YLPIGFLDGIDGSGCAWGWACDPDNHDWSIRVDFYADGSTFIQSGAADQGSEQEVNSLCGGGYYHRFRTCLPAWTQGHYVTAFGIDTVSGLSNLPGWQCPQNPACTW